MADADEETGGHRIAGFFHCAVSNGTIIANCTFERENRSGTAEKDAAPGSCLII